MNITKLFTMVGLLGLIVLSTGCSIWNLEPDEVLEKSLKEMKNISSYEVNIKSESNPNPEESNNSTSTLNSEVVMEPFSLHMNRSNDDETWGTFNSELYVSNKTVYHLDLYEHEEEENQKWVKFPLDNKKMFLFHDDLQVVLDNLEYFTFSSNEDEYRFKLNKYHKAVKPLWVDALTYTNLTMDSFSTKMVKALLEESNLSNFSYELTIDKKTLLIKSSSMNYEYGIDILGIEIPAKIKGKIKIEYDQYNKVAKINLPKEVKNEAVHIDEEEEPEAEEMPEVEVKGNTDANHANGSNFAQDQQNVYFTNSLLEPDGIFKLNDDLTEKEMLSPVQASELNLYGDWIYFSSYKDRGIFKIKKDGTGLEKIANDYAVNFKLFNDSFYFSSPEDTSHPLYRMNIDGTGKTKLLDHVFRFTVHRNQLIYQYDPHGELYVLEIGKDEYEAELIPNATASMFNVYGDYLYFENDSDESRLYRVNVDGTDFYTESISQSGSAGFNIASNSIYFTNMSDDYSLYHLDLTTFEETKLDHDSSHLHIAGNHLFYQKHTGGLDMYWFKMKLGDHR